MVRINVPANTTAGTVLTHSFSIEDDDGAGVAAVQVAVTGALNYDVVGRVTTEAPWVAIKAGQTAGFLESMNWIPFLGVRVNSGTGSAILWAETA